RARRALAPTWIDARDTRARRGLAPTLIVARDTRARRDLAPTWIVAREARARRGLAPTWIDARDTRAMRGLAPTSGFLAGDAAADDELHQFSAGGVDPLHLGCGHQYQLSREVVALWQVHRDVSRESQLAHVLCGDEAKD